MDDDNDEDVILGSGSSASADAETLERVLQRARRVQEQLQQARVDTERVRRQCVQEMELNRCMSEAGWRSGCDSDDGDDVGNLEDLDGLTPPGSPRRGLRRMRSGSSISSGDSSPRADSPRPSLLLTPTVGTAADGGAAGSAAAGPPEFGLEEGALQGEAPGTRSRGPGRQAQKQQRQIRSVAPDFLTRFFSRSWW